MVVRDGLDQWSHIDDGQLVTAVLTDGSEITATDHHLFWVANDGRWVELEDVGPGDSLLTPDGVTTVAHVVTWPTGDRLVWELDTAGPNTFTVNTGATDVLVHNAPKCDLVGFRKDHILNRHRHGAGKPGKTEFPKDWTDDKIIEYVSDIASDPNARRSVGRYGAEVVEGVRDGVKVRIEFYPDFKPDGTPHPNAGKISTAYPPDVTPNPG